MTYLLDPGPVKAPTSRLDSRERWFVHLPGRGIFRYTFVVEEGAGSMFGLPAVIVQRGTAFDGWVRDEREDVKRELLARHGLLR